MVSDPIKRPPKENSWKSDFTVLKIIEEEFVTRTVVLVFISIQDLLHPEKMAIMAVFVRLVSRIARVWLGERLSKHASNKSISMDRIGSR